MFSNGKTRRGTNEPPAAPERERAVVMPPASSPPPSGVASIISPDMTIRGNLTSPGTLRIEGTVIGDIDVEALVVADGATIQGEIKAQVAEISGALTGQIRAKDITLKSSARVIGDIYYEVLTMEPRAEFEGQCRRTSPGGQGALPAPGDTLQITKDVPKTGGDAAPKSAPLSDMGLSGSP